MAETSTPEQIAYDQELARIKTLTGEDKERAQNALAKKYPNGRPTGTIVTPTPVTATSQAAADAYDAEYAALQAMPEGRAKIDAFEAFRKKYPNGRPSTGASPFGSTTSTSVSGDGDLEKTLGIAPILLTDASKYKDALNSVKALYENKNFVAAKAAIEKFYLDNKLTVQGLQRYTLSLKNTDAYKEALREWLVPIRAGLATGNFELTDKELEDYFLRGTSNTIIFEDAYKKSVGTGLGPERTILNTLSQIAERNGFNLQRDFANNLAKWQEDLRLGKPAEIIYQQIRDAAAAKQTNPFIQKLLNEGNNLRDIYAPYINAMASTFRISADQIKLDDPLLAGVITDKGGISLGQFESSLYSDSRYNSALGTARIGDYKQVITDWIVQQGFELDDAAITRITNQAISLGLAPSSPQIKNLVDAEYTYTPGSTLGGLSGKRLSSLRQTAAANGLNLEKDFGPQLDNWLTRMSKGEDIETFNSMIRGAAKIGLPEEIGKMIDQGMNLDTIMNPYRNARASILEINPDSIPLNELVQMAITDKGFVPVYKFKQNQRKDPLWQNTDNARQEASSVAYNVLRDFGFVG